MSYVDISSNKICKWPMNTWKDAQNHMLLGKWNSKPQWVTSHSLGWLQSRRQIIITVDKDIEKLKLLFCL